MKIMIYVINAHTQIESNQTEPNQTKPNQTKPNQTKPNYFGPSKTTTNSQDKKG
jgi:hypothetical protein